MSYYPLNVGIGSQPVAEDEALNYLSMPTEMHTYRPPRLPEPETLTAEMTGAKTTLQKLYEMVQAFNLTQTANTIELGELDAKNLNFIGQVLGDGEVKIKCTGKSIVNIQESVMAGIWHLQRLDEQGKIVHQQLDIGEVPNLLRDIIHEEGQTRLTLGDVPTNLMNAPAILVEVDAKQQTCAPNQPAHVINLSLLPISEEDQTFMINCLGTGTTTILSKGYGNCRITSTAIRYVWWVRYYNSMDNLILNTIEIVDIPQVAKAAKEDLEDSEKRLQGIMRDYLNWL
ncbi:hydrogenase expression/formation protein [Beggiatoa leptomitoformis]|uniref:Hydrogenase expression/formation protein n=1 Tax=Beggiatoa leptomitoformis TaxID=288004 RepID=A0A2N9YC11_9GAMM|nr:hydrogenase expression/formation protein [Beggiatoa leptomitoformis]ALG66683.1 hydrogenase expression/formation protein [Beggiatoa leptomitoformis]AUI67991.1 hydrogenase expression/formation protein [Beggiatoa leptomitoformis]